jgi:hypothetical protein
MEEINALLNNYLGSTRALNILNGRNHKVLSQTYGIITGFYVNLLDEHSESLAFGVGIPTYCIKLETKGFNYENIPITALTTIKKVDDYEPIDGNTTWVAHKKSYLFDSGEDMFLGIICTLCL